LDTRKLEYRGMFSDKIYPEDDEIIAIIAEELKLPAKELVFFPTKDGHTIICQTIKTRNY